MTICPICNKDLPDPDGVLAGVLALDTGTREAVLDDLLAHRDARKVLGDPWADEFERAEARKVLGLPEPTATVTP